MRSSVEMLNTSSPPGRRRRAASGTVRSGSQKLIAPWSQNTTSNDASPERRGDRGSPARSLSRAAGRVPELRGRQVEPDGTRRRIGERRGPLRRAAAELEHVEAAHVAEHPELGLGDAPHAPAAAGRRGGRRGSAWYASASSSQKRRLWSS